MDFRVASAADVDAVAETLTLAFRADPVWGPALARSDGDEAHLLPIWRLYVEGSRRFDGAYVTGDAAAVSIWTPAGESELSDAQEHELTALINDSIDADRLDALMELFDRFEAAHPRDEPHAYLGLLATHPNHRGHGIAQQLLAENLKELDARGIPSYLESTNPANDHRYERLGYSPVGEFRAALDDAVITTMWREARL